MKLSYFIFLVIFITSCSDGSADKKNVSEIRNIGIQISNYMIGGSSYTDSAAKIYAFRSIRSVIKNDTTVPITLQFDIPKTWTDLEPKEGQKYVCFLLPDSMTSDLQFDARGQLSSRLKSHINSRLAILTSRTLTIQPKDTSSFKIGFLITPTDGTFRAILFSQEKFHRQISDSIRETSGHDLKLYLTIPPLSSAITIGSMTFLNE